MKVERSIRDRKALRGRELSIDWIASLAGEG